MKPHVKGRVAVILLLFLSLGILGGCFVPTPSGQGTLHISSTPSGAQVFIDGTYRGSTPLTVQLATGTHSVVVRASGFPDAQRSVTIQSGFSHTITVTFGSGP